MHPCTNYNVSLEIVSAVNIANCQLVGLSKKQNKVIIYLKCNLSNVYGSAFLLAAQLNTLNQLASSASPLQLACQLASLTNRRWQVICKLFRTTKFHSISEYCEKCKHKTQKIATHLNVLHTKFATNEHQSGAARRNVNNLVATYQPARQLALASIQPVAEAKTIFLTPGCSKRMLSISKTIIIGYKTCIYES